MDGESEKNVWILSCQERWYSVDVAENDQLSSVCLAA